MAYSIKYRLAFVSLDGTQCRFEILQNEYTGGVINLVGASRSPVVQSWDASDILEPVRGCKVVVRFVDEIVRISDFLTVSETKFLGNLYVGNVLKFAGFMVIDDFQAAYLTPPTESVLTFTDGLALLDNVTLSDAGFTVTSGRVKVTEIIEKVLLLTNLQLPLKQFYNLFPAGSTDTATRLGLQYINIKSFLTSDDDFENCRLVLEKILRANCCSLLQQNGGWVIVRIPEYKRFSGRIPGGGANVITSNGINISWTASIIGTSTTFTYSGAPETGENYQVGDTMTFTNASNPVFNLSYNLIIINVVGNTVSFVAAGKPAGAGSGSFTATIVRTSQETYTLPASKNIPADILPVRRSQTLMYQRPAMRVINTLNYRIPQLLNNSNLQRLGNLIGTSTSGSTTLRDYQFVDWSNQNVNSAFIRVVTDSLTGNEIDRYIVSPWVVSPSGGQDSGFYGSPIEVSKGDRFTFSFQYRAANDDNNTSVIRMGIVLETVSGRKNLIFFQNTNNPGVNGFRWTAAGIAPGSPFQATFPSKFNQGSEVMTEWRTYDFMDFDFNGFGLPPIPEDGILYVFITGFNHNFGSGTSQFTGYFKDFNFQYLTFINNSTQIKGQEHKSSQAVAVKNEISKEIFIDDAPKYNVAGGLFYNNGTGIVRTSSWIKEIGENLSYRHGQVNAIDEMLLRSNWRSVVEGDFNGNCSMLDSFTIDGVGGLFIPSRLETDYKQNAVKLSLQEISKDTDPSFSNLEYAFRFLYKTNL